MAGTQQGEVRTALSFRRWGQVDGARWAGGRLPQYWRDVLDDDPLMRDVVMVIDLVFGGDQSSTSVRVATSPVESVSGMDGLSFAPFAVLEDEPDVDHVYVVGDGTSSARSIALSIDVKVFDPVQAVAQGTILAGVAEVALEPRAGSDYDQRLVLLRGDIDGGVDFGAFRPASAGLPARDAESMQLEVVDPRETCQTKLPPWVVTRKRYPDAHKSGLGERVPIVVNGYTNIPAVRVTNNVTGGNDFIFAAGDGFSVDTTTGVSVNGVTRASGHATYGWTAFAEQDALGVLTSGIRFTVGATVWEDNDAVHVTATHSEQLSVVRAVQRVLERFSPLGMAGVHPGLFGEAAGKFPASAYPEILINGGSGGSDSGALEWAEEGIAAAFPMLSMAWEGGGYGPIVTDFRGEPVAEWVAGEAPIFDRDSTVAETPKASLYNEFVLRYGYDPMLDVYEEVEVLGPDNSSLCAYSAELVGDRAMPPISAPYLRSRPLAVWIVEWLAAHTALPSYYCEWVAGPRVLLERRRGDVVLFSSDEFGWTRERATVERISYRRGRCIVGLRVWLRRLNLGGSSLSVPSGGRS